MLVQLLLGCLKVNQPSGVSLDLALDQALSVVDVVDLFLWRVCLSEMTLKECVIHI